MSSELKSPIKCLKTHCRSVFSDDNHWTSRREIYKGVHLNN